MNSYIAFYQHDEGPELDRTIEAESLTAACKLAKQQTPERFFLYDVREREGWLEYNLWQGRQEKDKLEAELFKAEGFLKLTHKKVWHLAQEAYSRGYGISHDELRRLAKDAGEEV